MNADIEPFFTTTEYGYVPSAIAVGPWGPGTVNGRLLGGLVAQVLNEKEGLPDFRPARFHVDLISLANMGPIDVATESIHEGKRIRLATAVARQGGRPVARASVLFARPGVEPDGETWNGAMAMQVPDWDFVVPSNHSIALMQYNETGDMSQDFAAWTQPLRRQAWIRETRLLVDGRPLTPLVRAAMAADALSPMINWSSQGLQFINVDYTINFARPPEGERIGLGALQRLSSDGIAVCAAAMHDHLGAFAVGNATALAKTSGFAVPRSEADHDPA